MELLWLTTQVCLALRLICENEDSDWKALFLYHCCSFAVFDLTDFTEVTYSFNICSLITAAATTTKVAQQTQVHRYLVVSRERFLVLDASGGGVGSEAVVKSNRHLTEVSGVITSIV